MLFGQIFLYYYIIKALPHLTLYHLKDKKGVGHLIALKTMDVMQMSILNLYTYI
jgi:hypothetical protein